MHTSEVIKIAESGKEEYLRSLVSEENESAATSEEMPIDLKEEVNAIFRGFVEEIEALQQQKGSELDFSHVSKLMNLCRVVDDIQPNPELVPLIAAARMGILHQLIDAHYNEKENQLHVGPESVEAIQRLRRERSLAHLLAKILPKIDSFNPPSINQHWLAANLNSIVDKVKEIILEPETNRENWEMFREMLPDHWREKFVVSRRMRDDEKYFQEVVLPCRDIILRLGSHEAAAQFLISSGLARGRDRTQIVKIIAKYLGKCRMEKPVFADIVKCPAAMLQVTEIHRLLFIYLRNYIYKKLMDGKAEDPHKAVRDFRFHHREKEVEEILKDKVGKDSDEQRLLFNEVFSHFQDVFGIKPPKRMVDHIEKEGKSYEFPSERQRMFMKEMKRAEETGYKIQEIDNNLALARQKLTRAEERQEQNNMSKLQQDIIDLNDQKVELIRLQKLARRKFLEFFADYGKTATAFLTKEHLGLGKMLYMCPNGLEEQLITDHINKYYKEGERPTTAIIRPGMKPDELEEAMEAEVVIMPYSLLESKVDGLKITDRLKTKDVDIEFQGTKKNIYFCPQCVVAKTLERLQGGDSQSRVAAYDTREFFKEKLDSLLHNNDTIVLPLTFLNKEISPNGQRVKEYLGIGKIKDWFDIMILDEAHNVKNVDGAHAREVRSLAYDIPGIYEDGYTIGMSAELTPNTLDDLINYLAIYDRDTYGDIKTMQQALSKIDTLILRNAIHDMIFRIDGRENWEQFVEYVDLLPYEEERDIYNSIIFNDLLTPKQKIRRLQHVLLKPNLYSINNEQVVSRIFDETIKSINEFLFEGDKDTGKLYDSMVIAEEIWNQGFVRRSKNRGKEHLPPFIDEVAAHYRAQGYTVNIFDGTNGQPPLTGVVTGEDGKPVIDLYIIDGPSGSVKGFREKALDAAKVQDGRKRIYFSILPTMYQGKNLSHIHRALGMSPSYRKMDTGQHVKRYNREHNEDAKLRIFRFINSIHTGKHENAEQKAEKTNELKEGDQISDDDLAFLAMDDFEEKIIVGACQVRLGTPILTSVMTPKQKLDMIYAYLNNIGTEEYLANMDNLGKLFAELYSAEQAKSYHGNNGRFVAGLFKTLEERGIIKGNVYCDVGCGLLELENTLGVTADGRERNIYSMDLNPYMLEQGIKILKQKKPPRKDIHVDEGTMSKRSFYKDGMFHAINKALNAHCTRLNTAIKKVGNAERVQDFMEDNRTLMKGGALTITLPRDIGTDEERRNLAAALQSHFGFKLTSELEEFNGIGVSVDNDEGQQFDNFVITLVKEHDILEKDADGKEINHLDGLDLTHLQLSQIKREYYGRTGAGKPIGASKVSQGYLHTQFRVEGLAQPSPAFEFQVGLEEDLKNQEKYNERAKAARTLLRKIYFENSKRLEHLDPNDLAELKNQRINIVPLYSKKGNPVYCFSFASSSKSEQLFALDEEGEMIDTEENVA